MTRTNGKRLSPLSRAEALRLLRVSPAADTDEVKRAYRRLAREHHPDVGGDPATFHELQAAYELLVGGAAPTSSGPTVDRGRPSRTWGSWTPEGDGIDRSRVDVSTVDFDAVLGEGEERLDRHRLAVALARDDTQPVHPVAATSRSPGSRLNRAAHLLNPDLTSHLEVTPATDDRGRTVVRVQVSGANRKARRALDGVGLEGWSRLRGSSTTVLRLELAPSTDRRATIVRTVDRIEDLLDRLAWPLSAWTLTRS